MTNVHDVAAYVTEHFDSSISTMKLQKLCFFAQGWSLALLNEPLFGEDFQAWRNGPVCYELFDHHRREYSVSDWPLGFAGQLDQRQQIVVDAMLDNYGALSGIQLSELTHREGTPWKIARDQHGIADGASSSVTIDQALMHDYFVKSLLPEEG